MPKRTKRRVTHTSRSHLSRRPKVKTYPKLAILSVVLLTLVGLGYVWVYYNKINVRTPEIMRQDCPARNKCIDDCIKTYGRGTVEVKSCRSTCPDCSATNSGSGGGGAECWCTTEKECQDKKWNWNNDPYCRDYYDHIGGGKSVPVDLGCCTAPGEPTKAPLGGNDCIQTCINDGGYLQTEDSCEDNLLKPWSYKELCVLRKTKVDKKTCCCTYNYDCNDKENLPPQCNSVCLNK